MKGNNVKFGMPRRAAVAIMACVLLVGTLTVAYAADLGGIRQSVRFWMQGVETEAELVQNEDYSYTLTWQDENGETHEMGGGGVAMEADGTERPVTPEEYLEHLRTTADVENTDDGRVMLYYYDQALDITDAFDADDNCKIALEHDGVTTYIVVHGNWESDWAVWQSNDGFDEVIEEVNEALSASALGEEEQSVAIEIPDGEIAGE